MAYRRFGYRRSRRFYNTRPAGLERALEHIAEARAFSEEVGYGDIDLKRYFFSLQAQDLQKILDEYGRLYGTRARRYAADTIGEWRCGMCSMSGLVANRLYELLPKYMPTEQKLQLVKRLWEAHSPRSTVWGLVGPNADEHELTSQVEAYLDRTVVATGLPESLRRRFTWLAAGEVSAYSRLLDHFFDLDKRAALGALRERIPLFFREIRQVGPVRERITQEVLLGKHRLRLIFDPNISGSQLAEVAPASPRDGRSDQRNVASKSGCLVAMVVIISIAALLGILS